jgi:chaperonin GroEL
MTGGQVFSTEKGMKLDKFDWKWFGEARVVTVNKDNTTIVDGKGTEEAISARIEELQSQIEKAQSPYEREKLQERLAKFIGGVAIVHVGGNTETEMREKKDRVDDALHATKAALEEGIVPGGGSALLFAREAINDACTSCSADHKLGQQIVYKACAAPFKKILQNAGYDDAIIYGFVDKMKVGDAEKYDKKLIWQGFDLKSNEFVNMKEAGIIDPAKVTREALQNAASVAGTILLTECVVVDTPEEKKDDAPGFGGMGGMF